MPIACSRLSAALGHVGQERPGKFEEVSGGTIYLKNIHAASFNSREIGRGIEQETI
jgi:hypothetical protein